VATGQIASQARAAHGPDAALPDIEVVREADRVVDLNGRRSSVGAYAAAGEMPPLPLNSAIRL